MSLWFCPKCGTLTNNSMVCRFGCGETQRVSRINTNGGKDLVDLNQQLHQEREAREDDKEWINELGQHLEEWKDDFHQEREVREQHADILRKLVEAQDEIDVEAEKPLHQRSTAPMVKKIEAIKEARRVLGGE